MRLSDPAIEKRRPWWPIWLVSLGLWTFIAIANGFSMYEWRKTVGYSTSLPNELILPLVNYLVYGVLTPFVFRLGRQYPITRDRGLKRVSLYLLGSVAFSVIHVVVRVLVYPVNNADGGAIPIGVNLFKTLIFYNLVDDVFFAYLPVVLVAHMISYYQQFRNRELRASHLETQLAQTQLDVLKSQLQPHFLFNTLHSISSLMLTNVQAADQMMSRLSNLLRMTLENAGVQETTLNCEMDFVNGYLEIEKIRFEERLEVCLDIAPDTLDATVPYLVLQPLVENAVRHGISKLSSGGEIRITSWHDEKYLYLKVHDNGPGVNQVSDSEGRQGLGLRATRERLQTLYGADQLLALESIPEHGTDVRLQIPFRISHV